MRYYAKITAQNKHSYSEFPLQQQCNAVTTNGPSFRPITTSPPSNITQDPDFIFGIVAAIVILFLALGIIVVGINLWQRTRKKRHQIAGNEERGMTELELVRAGELQNGNSITHSNGRVDHVPKDKDSRLSYYTRYESVKIRDSPSGIPVDEFPNFVHLNRQSLELIDEFEHLPGVNVERQSYAKEEANKPKNRYRNILPYNNTRVVLEKIDGDPYSDYINASYIDSFDREKAYICTQGPKNNTISDFWRMVWQEKIRVIAMVTNLEEGLKKKCECYWPSGDKVGKYGDVTVSARHTEEREFGFVRKFVVKKSEESRGLIHFQFTKWPDKSVPKQTSLLLRYLQEVKAEYATDDSAPLLVHCSAGIGRTGVVITLDSVVEQAKKTGKVNIHGFVQAIRESRQNMVQTDEQYVFVHEAVLEMLLFVDTVIPIDRFSERLKELRESQSGSRVTLLDKEFSTLLKLCPDPAALATRTGSRHENTLKNRDACILPIERNRAMLQTRVNSDTAADYINASFVRSGDEHPFILTQMPLPDTVVDFWSLIYDYKPTRIVMLNEFEREDPTCAQYWPDGGSTQYGPFTVSTTSTEKDKGLIVRTLQVQLTGTQNVRVVRQYQFLGWPGDDSRFDDQNKSLLLDLIEAVYSSASGVEPYSKVLVHCMNGAGRSGVFCAVRMCLDQMTQEGTVDVFQAVKALRADRMRMVTSVEEYIFCYEVLEEYIKRKDTDEEDDHSDDDVEATTESHDVDKDEDKSELIDKVDENEAIDLDEGIENLAFVGDD
ncbi:receptor-type tyrosine-protein phosphatase epsilon-like [Diadema setosum]|uniref:receptor-type tyrosine-protein phosphatase epsilon-like n=1 Tax=Diadema setosum TaxID=31175 RepID=UPI003B3B0A5E